MAKQVKDDLEAVRVIVAALEEFETQDQERILRWAREKLGLAGAGEEVRFRYRPEISAAPVVELNPQSSVSKPVDIKTFVDSKQPNSDIQFATTVAYYYRFAAPPQLRKESISAEDLKEACRQVGRGHPARAAQTLVNAHAQGLLTRGDRGLYSINTVGENLVALTLPTKSPTGAKGAKRPAKKSARYQ